ncbi:glycosyltransferase [uncultured Pseudomonas sp.]|uniref:glycosyltransferase family 2 protein n=1 Tax=uncultured Pseudomonas sp. TaxID=114707 RepID=UPI0025E42D32|nr:glycosyltransferase [uncultured Pseudomonas sp.]
MDVRTEAAIMSLWPAQYSRPLVSIVCLTFNHRDFIGQAIDGFLMQETDFPFEILINDDASTDGTRDILQAYAQRYPRLIRLILQQENQYAQGKPYGMPVFQQARGDYIAYCEGDDYWTDPRKLQLQVDFLERNRDYALTFHASYAFNSQGIVNPQRFDGRDHYDRSQTELKQALPLSTLTACFRNVLRGLPPELETAALMDIVWWSLLGAHGKGKFLAEIRPAAYRVHEGGIFSMRASQKRLQMDLHTQYCLANYYYRLGERDLHVFFLRQVLNLSLSSIPPKQKLRALARAVCNIVLNLGRRFAPKRITY